MILNKFEQFSKDSKISKKITSLVKCLSKDVQPIVTRFTFDAFL